MSHHREALVFALIGFMLTMTVSIPPIVIEHLEKAERIEAYERSAVASYKMHTIRTS